MISMMQVSYLICEALNTELIDTQGAVVGSARIDIHPWPWHQQ
jgi:hypothetical protein